MASVTGLTADRMLAIEAMCVVDGGVILDHLILTRHSGETIDAGNVRGPQGDQGIQGIPGDPGVKGDTGDQGIQGIPGTTPTGVVNPTADTIPLRTSGGRLKVGTPTQDDDAVTHLVSRTTRKTQRMQFALHGGGARKCTVNTISWSSRFLAIGSGRDDLSLSGYYDITMPPNGTVIPVYGNSAVASVTVASGVIPFTNASLSGFAALYYELPYGSNFTFQAANFRIVDHSAALTFEIPNTWILIAFKTADSGTPIWKWGDGQKQDYWRSISFTGGSGWVAFGGEYEVPGWRYAANGKIELKGVIKSGVASTTTAVVTWPAGSAPDDRQIFMTIANGGQARFDIKNTGEFLMYAFLGGATNTFVSLENISWYPAGY